MLDDHRRESILEKLASKAAIWQSLKRGKEMGGMRAKAQAKRAFGGKPKAPASALLKKKKPPARIARNPARAGVRRSGVYLNSPYAV